MIAIYETPWTAGGCMALAIALLSSTAFAQSGPPSTATPTPSDATAPAPVEAATSAPPSGQPDASEIVVTAQLRSQRIQDVPVSIQVVNGASIAQQNRNSLVGLAQIQPSIHVGANGRATELYIRGIGSGVNQTFDQSVGIFIDGLYHGRSRIGIGTYLDLDRVEILKGPQSTFFGNNAIAGAFSIVTRGPTQDSSGDFRALYGTRNQYAVEAAAGGPLSDTFGARIAVIASGEDGWLRNVTSGKRVPNLDSLAGRITLKAMPSDSFDATVRLEGSRNHNSGLRPTQLLNCPPPSPLPTGASCALAITTGQPLGTDNNKGGETANQFSLLKTAEGELTMNYHLGETTLTAITGYYAYDYKAALDADALAADRINVAFPESYHQFSQEVRLTSPSDRPLEYILGGYFQSDRLHLYQQFTYGQLTPVIQARFPSLVPYLPIAQGVDYVQHEKSYAAFGALTWHVTDELRLTGGLRASWVDRNFDQSIYFGRATGQYNGLSLVPGTLGILPAQSTGLQATATGLGIGISGVQGGKRSDNALLPSARAQYNFNRDVMVYASYSRGFKAGGFNGVDTSGVPSNLPYDPEHVNAYEIGLRSELFDRHLLFNLTAFRSDYNALQSSVSIVTASGSIQSVVRNAASSVSQGLELETQLRVSRDFRITVNGTYLDAHYKDFPGVSLTGTQIFCRATYVLPYCASFPNPVPAFQDLGGRPTQFAPKWSASVTPTYDIHLANGWQIEPELTAVYSSRYYLTLLDDPYLSQKPFFRLDGRIAITPANGRWGLDIIGKNLTDTKIYVFGSLFAGANGSYVIQRDAPRNIAVQLRYRW